MRVSIITEDNMLGIDGVFRLVDLSPLQTQEIRAVQWDGEEGIMELNDGANFPITRLDNFQAFINAWYALTPVPTHDDMKAMALARINASYDKEILALTPGYSQHEKDSWAKQEAEARAWAMNVSAPTPWLNAASNARKVSKAILASRIIQKADAFAVIHGQLTGKRQALEDRIKGLGPNPAQESLDAVQW
jgi:hypothetical protein